MLEGRSEDYQEKKVHYKIPFSLNTSLMVGGNSNSGCHRGLGRKHSMKPSREASELEQIEESEEQKGKTKIQAREPRHPAGKATGLKMQLKICRQEWKY